MNKQMSEKTGKSEEYFRWLLLHNNQPQHLSGVPQQTLIFPTKGPVNQPG